MEEQKPCFFMDQKTIKMYHFSLFMMQNKAEKHKLTEKLILDQTNKQGSSIHYRDSKIYIKHRLKL